MTDSHPDVVLSGGRCVPTRSPRRRTARRRSILNQARLARLATMVSMLLVAAACGTDEASSTAATTASSPPTQTDTATTTVLSDVTYNEDPKRQILDVHVPAGDGPYPTILAIHGGRFSMNSKLLYNQHADYFADRGIAFVATNYRYAPTNTFPAQVEDVHCALAWIHENAERYGLDPTRVVVVGGSAGGYLAAMVGTVDDPDRFLTGCPHTLPDDPIAGAVIFYGIFDFIEIDDYPLSSIAVFQGLWGATHDGLSKERLKEMSPVAWVDGSEPPFLVIHGTRDVQIPSVMSERFVEVLKDSGVDAELLLVDAGHGFETQPINVPVNVESLTATEEFIARLP